MRSTRFLLLGLAAVLSACASLSDSSTNQPTLAYTLSENQELLQLDARAPQTVLARRPLTGLDRNADLVGLGRRGADGQLYALARNGQLYQVHPETAAARKIGTGEAPPGTPTFGIGTSVAGMVLSGNSFGAHFDPATDRLRVVSDTGLNLRLDPATSLVVDGDPARPGLQADTALRYAADDANAGKKPAVVAIAHAPDKADARRVTTYAIDRELGTLVVLGSVAGATPAVAPESGTLRTVGSLGIGRLRDAALDIDPRGQRAYAVVRTTDDLRVRLFTVDLQSGRARAVGMVDQGRPVRGLAIAP